MSVNLDRRQEGTSGEVDAKDFMRLLTDHIADAVYNCGIEEIARCLEFGLFTG